MSFDVSRAVEWKRVRSFSRRHSLFVAVFLLVSIGFPLVYLNRPFHIDEALFVVVGREIADGSALYTGVIDHKPPAIFYLAAAVSTLGVETYLALRILTAVVTLLTGVVVLWLGTRLYDETVGMAAALLFVVGSYLPHFDGFYFLTEPYATFCTVVAAALYLTARSRWSDVAVGVALGVGVMFNQTTFLFGAAVVAFSVFRLWLPEHRSHAALVDTTTRLLAIGVGFLAVVGLVVAFFAAIGSLTAFVTYAFVVPLTQYNPPFDLRGHVFMTLSFLPVWLLAFAMVVRSIRNLAARTGDEATLFVALWLAFISYPGLTGFVGDHKMLFTFPAVALLAARAIDLLWHTEAVAARVRSVTDRVRGRPGARVSSSTVVVLVVVVGLVVATVGFNAAYAAVFLTGSIDDQAAEAKQLDPYIEGPVYALPFFYQFAYFTEDTSPPETFVGGVYSEELAAQVISDLEQQSVDYVIVHKGHIDESGAVVGDNFFGPTEEPVAAYIDANYEPVGESEDYVVYRRQDRG